MLGGGLDGGAAVLEVGASELPAVAEPGFGGRDFWGEGEGFIE